MTDREAALTRILNRRGFKDVRLWVDRERRAGASDAVLESVVLLDALTSAIPKKGDPEWLESSAARWRASGAVTECSSALLAVAESNVDRAALATLVHYLASGPISTLAALHDGSFQPEAPFERLGFRVVFEDTSRYHEEDHERKTERMTLLRDNMMTILGSLMYDDE